jgi:hypothetical protein
MLASLDLIRVTALECLHVHSLNWRSTSVSDDDD